MSLRAALAALMLAGAVSPPGAAQPRYVTPETRETVERMIEAHGGMERWLAAPTVSFRRKATFAAAPDRPWILHETIEQGSRRLYQTWPEDDVVLASDGTEVWTVGWSRVYPPRFVAPIGFYFLNLPWLTQDRGVILEQEGRGAHPASNVELIRVAMTFEADIGDTPGDRYVLFIDPGSHVLRAVEYHVSYGALLDASFQPPHVRTIGPFFHVNERFDEVDGLKVPTRYTVYGSNGSSTITGEVGSWSFREPFDGGRMVKPPDAVVDESSPKRRVAAK